MAQNLSSLRGPHVPDAIPPIGTAPGLPPSALAGAVLDRFGLTPRQSAGVLRNPANVVMIHALFGGANPRMPAPPAARPEDARPNFCAWVAALVNVDPAQSAPFVAMLLADCDFDKPVELANIAASCAHAHMHAPGAPLGDAARCLRVRHQVRRVLGNMEIPPDFKRELIALLPFDARTAKPKAAEMVWQLKRLSKTSEDAAQLRHSLRGLFFEAALNDELEMAGSVLAIMFSPEPSGQQDPGVAGCAAFLQQLHEARSASAATATARPAATFAPSTLLSNLGFTPAQCGQLHWNAGLLAAFAKMFGGVRPPLRFAAGDHGGVCVNPGGAALGAGSCALLFELARVAPQNAYPFLAMLLADCVVEDRATLVNIASACATAYRTAQVKPLLDPRLFDRMQARLLDVVGGQDVDTAIKNHCMSIVRTTVAPSKPAATAPVLRKVANDLRMLADAIAAAPLADPGPAPNEADRDPRLPKKHQGSWSVLIAHEQHAEHALQKACEDGDVDAVKRLMDRDTLDSTCPRGLMPLQIACHFGHAEIVQLILRHKKNSASGCATPTGLGAWHLAVAAGHTQVVDMLVNADFLSCNEPTSDGVTPIMLAIDLGYPELAMRMLRNPGRSSEVRMLSGSGINLEGDRHGITPLYLACVHGARDVVEALIECDSPLHCPYEDPIAAARRHGHADIADLIEKAASERRTASEAAFTHTPDWRQWSGRLGFHTDLNRPDGNGLPPLHAAIAGGDERFMEELLANPGVDPDFTDANGITPLMRAVQSRNAKLVALLLGHPDVDPDAEDRNGKTAFFHACELGLRDVAGMLAARNVKLTCSHGDALEAAKKPMQPEVADAVQRERAAQARFAAACRDGNLELVEQMLAQGQFDPDPSHSFNPNFLDASGKTPLGAAIRNGRQAVVTALTESRGTRHYPVDLALRDAEGRTALDNAVSAGDLKLAQLLLQMRAGRPRDDARLLDAAVESRSVAMLKEVLGLPGLNINAAVKKGLTALHAAIQLGFDAAVDMLLDDPRTNPEASSAAGITPLYIACRFGRVRAAKRLLDLEVRLTCAYKDPYTSAVSNNHPEVAALVAKARQDRGMVN